jgi:hypothetical protein
MQDNAAQVAQFSCCTPGAACLISPFAERMRRKIVIGVTVLVLAFGAFLASGIFQLAKRDSAKWDYMSFNEVVIGLRNYYADETSYSAYDVKKLHELGCLHDASVKFLKRKDVGFYPFSSSDSPDKVVLEMRLLGEDLVVTKDMITNPPKDMVRPVTQLTFDCNRVLTSEEKSAVFSVLMSTPGGPFDRTYSSIDFTTHTIVDVQPITDEDAFVAALDLGHLNRTGKRRYRLTLDESNLRELVGAKTESSEQDGAGQPAPRAESK